MGDGREGSGVVSPGDISPTLDQIQDRIGSSEYLR